MFKPIDAQKWVNPISRFFFAVCVGVFFALDLYLDVDKYSA